MEFKEYDHTFMELGRLGENLPDLVIGGDASTWGEGSMELGQIHNMEPTLGNNGPSFLIINGAQLDLMDYDIEYDALEEFVTKNFKSTMSELEMEFVLFMITSTYFGEKNGAVSGQQIDEWPLEILTKAVGRDLNGRLIMHLNTRYDCSTSVSDTGEVEWLDNVSPDDDAQRLAVAS